MDLEKLTASFNSFTHKIQNQFFYIDKAWFYGSRHKGKHRSDSDYDIAIQVIWKKDNLDGILEEIIEQETGEKVKIDIKFYSEDTPECTPQVNEGINDSSSILFRSAI